MTTISEGTKFTLPLVAAIISATVTGTVGVTYLANKMDQQDRRLARIERKLGISEGVGASWSDVSGSAFAAERPRAPRSHGPRQD